MSSESQRRSLPRFLLILLTVCSVALAGIAASMFVSEAGADHSRVEPGEEYCRVQAPGGGELTIREVLNKGFKVIFRCTKNNIGQEEAAKYLETVKVTGKFTVTPRVKRALGLRSRVIAGGTWTRGGPAFKDSCTIEEQKCRYYTLRFPAAAYLKAKFKKKRVGMIRLHPEATVEYTSADGTPGRYTFTEHRFDGPIDFTTGAASFACAKTVGRDLWYGCKQGGFRP